jgi:hypothetical protein
MTKYDLTLALKLGKTRSYPNRKTLREFGKAICQIMHPQRTIERRRVIHATSVYLAAILTMTVWCVGPTVAAVCAMPPQASLKLERRHGAFLVPVTIQDKPAYLILNLSAPLSSITRQGADRLGLPVTHLSDSALESNGKLVKTFVRMSNLTMGGLNFPPYDSMVEPHSDEYSDFAAPDVVGTLGTDLLGNSDIELDLAQARMTLYPAGQCGDQAPDWAAHGGVVPLRRSPVGSFYFSMALDGRKIETAFSTVNSCTTIPTDLSKRVYGFDKTSPGLEETPGANGHTVLARVMQLSASSLTLADEKVVLHDPLKDCMLVRKPDGVGYDYCFGTYPLLLGLNVLLKLHIYIDMHNNLMYFTRNQ